MYGSTKASTSSQLDTPATCGPYFSPCQSRCICGLQDTGLWNWSYSKALTFSWESFHLDQNDLHSHLLPPPCFCRSSVTILGGWIITCSDSLIWSTMLVGFDLTESTFKSLNCSLRLGWSNLTLPCNFYSHVMSWFKKQKYLKSKLGRKRDFSVVSLVSHICGIMEGQIWQIWVDSHSHETTP